MGFWGSVFGGGASGLAGMAKWGAGFRRYNATKDVTTLGLGGGLAAGQRVLFGAGVGAVYGGAFSDMSTPEGMAGDIVKNALIGGAAGLATTGGFWHAATGFSFQRAGMRTAANKAMGKWLPGVRGYTKEAENPLKRGAGVAGTGAKVGYRVGKDLLSTAGEFAMTFPRLTGGAVVMGGAAGMMAMGAADPVRQQAADRVMPYMSGPSPEEERLRSSTAGVVQGLHSSRHGGW